MSSSLVSVPKLLPVTLLTGFLGSGKTTLMRTILGLLPLTHGSITRNFNQSAMVFQNYALFPWLTARENVAFGLQMRGISKKERERIAREKLNEMGLAHLEDRYPGALSGGQRQRIALARALAVEPKVLLLDEPFGALDAKVRKELRRWLRRLHDEMHVTTVFVTHDQEEAMEVSDRIVVMNQGRIEQEGTPDQVYDHPATPFVLQFLGDVNLFHGRLDHNPGGAASHGEVSYVRPHELEIVAQPEAGTWPVVLSQSLTVGPNTRLEFKRLDDDSYVDVELPREEWHRLRETLQLAPGGQAHLKARRVTRFHSAA